MPDPHRLYGSWKVVTVQSRATVRARPRHRRRNRRCQRTAASLLVSTRTPRLRRRVPESITCPRFRPARRITLHQPMCRRPSTAPAGIKRRRRLWGTAMRTGVTDKRSGCRPVCERPLAKRAARLQKTNRKRHLPRRRLRQQCSSSQSLRASSRPTRLSSPPSRATATCSWVLPSCCRSRRLAASGQQAPPRAVPRGRPRQRRVRARFLNLKWSHNSLLLSRSSRRRRSGLNPAA